ncbi:MAG: hypothetical protein ACI959_000461 [Limisphaerales bacterium]
MIFRFSISDGATECLSGFEGKVKRNPCQMKIYLFTVAICLAIGASAQPFNTYLSLDGIDDHSDVSTASGIVPGASDFTIEGWMRACGSTGFVFDNRLGNNGPGVEFEITDANEMTLRMEGPSGFANALDTTFEFNFNGQSWLHFALTHDNTTGENVFFISGRPVIQVVHDFSPNADFFIGQSDLATKQFDGWLDEFRVSTEIRYSGFYNPDGPFTSDALTRALWHFDDAIGALSFVDESANAFHLVPQNGIETQEEFFVMPADETCPGGTVDLQAVGGSSFSWVPVSSLDDPFVANPVASPGSSTYYGVSISDDNSCIHTEWVYAVVHDSPFEASVSDGLICRGTMTQLFADGGVEYFWDPIGSNLQSPFVTVDVPTTYTVTITDVWGCEGVEVVTVGVEDCLTGWDEDLDLFNFTVGPNPSLGTFQVQLGLVETSPIQLEIYDMLGRMVSNYNQGVLVPGAHSIKLNTALSSGRYIMVARSDKGSQVMNISIVE